MTLAAFSRLLRLGVLLVIFVHRLGAAELNVFAAASLSDALKAIAAKYEKQSGDKLRFNFGASSLLGRQIQEGAPADVFFSADEEKMDILQKRGLLIDETRKSLLSNTLIIVTSHDAALVNFPLDLAKVRRLALAETKTVPAGIYARRYLEKTGLWQKVKDKVVPTENVRAALSAVEAGNVDAAIVYKTDALISKKVKIAYEVPISQAPDISYSVAVIKDAKSLDAARKFVQHLQSSEGLRVFEQHGFLVRK